MGEPASCEWAIIVYAHSRPGVLAKVASLFYRRALNIRTLTVGTAHEPELSKIVMRVAGAHDALQRVALSIRNLIDVLSVEMHDLSRVRAQELCLVRIAAADGPARAAVLAAAGEFAAVLIESGQDSVVFELAGPPTTLDRFTAAVAPFTIRDISRTGMTTMPEASAPTLAGP